MKKLGKDDLLIRWRRPYKLKGLRAEELRKLPRFLMLRQVKITVNQAGFRSKAC